MKSVSFAVLFLLVIIGQAFGQQPASTNPSQDSDQYSPGTGYSDEEDDSGYIYDDTPRHVKIFCLSVVGKNEDNDATKEVNAWIDSTKNKIVIVGEPKVIAVGHDQCGIVMVYTYIDKPAAKPAKPAPSMKSAVLKTY